MAEKPIGTPSPIEQLEQARITVGGKEKPSPAEQKTQATASPVDAIVEDVSRTSSARLVHSVIGGVAEGSRELLRTGVMLAEQAAAISVPGLLSKALTGVGPFEMTKYYDSLIPHYSEIDPDERQPRTITEGLAGGIAQFVGVYSIANKILKAAELGTDLTRVIGAGFIGDIGAFSEDTPNLADLAGTLHPVLQEYVGDYLGASDQSLPALERKLRTGLTGFLPPALIGGFIGSVQTARLLANAEIDLRMGRELLIGGERGSIQFAPKPKPEKMIHLEHFSPEEALEFVDPKKHGKFAAGAEMARKTKKLEPDELGQVDISAAEAYIAAGPIDSTAIPSWNALKSETDRLFREISNKVKIEPVTGQPYETADAMNADIAKGTFKVTTDNSEHPLWNLNENFKFRVVHDYLGHYSTGADFSLGGEKVAYLEHAKHIKDPQALDALKTEVYGQAAAMKYAGGIFQQQKIVKLPEAPAEFQDRSYFYEKGTEPEARFKGLHKYAASIPAAKVFDMGSEEGQTLARQFMDPTARENELIRRGFLGIKDSQMEPPMNKVIEVFAPVKVKKVQREAITNPFFRAFEDVGEDWTVPKSWGKNKMPTVGAGVIYAGNNSLEKFSAAWKRISSQYSNKEWSSAELKALYEASKERAGHDLAHQGELRVLPKIEEIKGYIDKGMWNSGWYDNIQTTLGQFIPKNEVPKVVAFLGAVSPGMSTAQSIRAGLYAYGLHKAGVTRASEFKFHLEQQDLGSAYIGTYNTLERIAFGEEAVGPFSQKVGPFIENLLGNYLVTTMDRHMGKMFGYGEKLTERQSEFMRATFSELGEQYGVAPARLQAAAWGAWREISLGIPRSMQKPMAEMIKETIEHDPKMGWQSLFEGKFPQELTDESGKISYRLALLVARAAVGATAGAYATDGSEIGAIVGMLTGASGPAVIRALAHMARQRADAKALAKADPSTTELLRQFKATSPSELATEITDIVSQRVAAQAKVVAKSLFGELNENFIKTYLGRTSVDMTPSELQVIGDTLEREAVKGQILVIRALKTGTPESYQEALTQINTLGTMSDTWRGIKPAESTTPEQLRVRLIQGATSWAAQFDQALQATGGTPRELLSKFSELSPRQAAMYAQSLQKPGAWEMWRELWINSLLWGKALLVNPVTNSFMLEWEIAKRLPLELVGAVPPGTTYQMFKEQARIHAIRDAFKATYHSIKKTSDDPGKIDIQYQPAITSEAMGIPPGIFAKALDGLGMLVRGSGETLIAEDAFFRSIGGRVALREYAYRTAYQEVQARRLSSKYQGPRMEGKQAAQFIQTRIDEIMASPPEDALHYMTQFSKLITFTEELGPAGQAIQQFQRTRVGTVVTPFVRAPYNIPKQAARNSPLGVVLPSFWEDVNSGDPHRRNLAISGVALGTAYAIVLAELATQGLISGNGPDDPNERRLMRERLGWQPMSYNVDGTWVSLNQIAGPFAMPMGIIADYVELRSHMTDMEADEFALIMAQSFANNFTNKTFVKGATGWLTAITDPERGAKGALSDFITSLVPFSTAMKSIEVEMDPYQREAKTILEKVRSRLPRLSEGLPIHVDLFGDAVASEGAIGPDLLSPLYFRTIKEDPVAKEMIRVGAFPGDHAKQVKNTKLTTPEISRLAVIVGKEVTDDEGNTLYDAMRAHIVSEAYQDNKEFLEVQRADLWSIIAQYRAEGQSKLLDESSDLRERVTQTLRKRGVDIQPEDFRLD